MIRIGLSSASVHLNDALGKPWYELNQNHTEVIGENRRPATLTLLDMPAELATNGVYTLDLCIQHIPSIDSGFLAELRAAIEAAGVELYQLLIDLGNVSSPDPAERSRSLAMSKRWMEIAAELGSSGIRYVPGESQPTPETIRLSGEALRELAAYALQLGLQPATENYKRMTYVAADLFEILALAENGLEPTHGLIADFGNAAGPNKVETLEALMPRATAIHAWAEYDPDGTLDVAEFQRCLNIARNHNFSGPIMLLGGKPVDIYRERHDLWSGVDELRQQITIIE